MDSIEAALKHKRAKLKADLARISTPPPESGGISFGKRVGEGTSMAVDRLVDVATHDRLQVVLADVDRALVKLTDGTYGECDRCGTDIPQERLEVLPWSVLCVRCAGRR